MTVKRRRVTRIAALLLAGLALAGCGFHPLYGEREIAPSADLAAVDVRPIPNRIGQMLELRLRDTFNPSGASVPKLYALQVVLQESRGNFAIRKDGTASREIYDIYCTFTLYRAGDHQSLFAGQFRSNDSFDVAENEYSVVVAEQNAQSRAVRDIGDNIRERVALFLRRQNAGL
jgi:LPS-assembly lipoprotein